LSFRNTDWVDLSSRVGRVKVKQVALREGVWGLLPSRDRLLFNMAVRWLDRVRKAWALEVLGRIVDKLRTLWLTLKSMYVRYCLRRAGRILEERLEAFKPLVGQVHPQFRDAYLGWLREAAYRLELAEYVVILNDAQKTPCFSWEMNGRSFSHLSML